MFIREKATETETEEVTLLRLSSTERVEPKQSDCQSQLKTTTLCSLPVAFFGLSTVVVTRGCVTHLWVMKPILKVLSSIFKN